VSINPYSSPETGGQPPEKAGSWKPTLLGVLAVFAAIGMLIALLLPARRGAGEAARRSQCINHLRQIALALQTYEQVHHALPPAYTVDAEGRPLHSWRTLILPFMEQQELYEKIDLTKPWDDPANREACETQVFSYRCPSATCPSTHTTYLAVVGTGGCFRPTEPRKLAEITDDHDRTLMVVEADSGRAVHWMSPADVSEREVLKLGSADRLPHRKGAAAVSVSGQPLFLTADFQLSRLRALVSIAGNDDEAAAGGN
jgi:hypothetical protein